MQGLTSSAAAAQFEADGPNAMTPGKQKPEWVKLAEQLFYGFAALLWIGSILCFIAYGFELSDNNNDVELAPKDNVSSWSRSAVLRPPGRAVDSASLPPTPPHPTPP